MIISTFSRQLPSFDLTSFSLCVYTYYHDYCALNSHPLVPRRMRETVLPRAWLV